MAEGLQTKLVVLVLLEIRGAFSQSHEQVAKRARTNQGPTDIKLAKSGPRTGQIMGKSGWTN